MTTAGRWTGRRRAAAVATVAAMAALFVAQPGPAATPTNCAQGAVVVARNHAPVSLSGGRPATAPFTADLCLQGTAQGAVLDLRAQPNNKSDSVQLELDTAGGSYLRSSRVEKAGAPQRVGLANPTDSSYKVSVTPGGLASVPFKGTVSLLSISSLSAPGFGSPVVLPKSGDGEPSVAIDRRKGDVVFVTAPVGIPSALNPIGTGNDSGGIDYWRCQPSAAGGPCSTPAAFAYQNISLGDGGGDSHVAVDGAGGVYYADLAAADVNLLKSTDEGKTVTQLLPTGNTTADREWLAPYLPDPGKGTGATTLHLAYHDFATQELWECNGPNGGTVTEQCGAIVPANDPSIFGAAVSNTIIGPQVLGGDGTIYVPFGTSTPAENAATGGSGPIDNLYVGVSKDGNSWNAYPVVKLKPGSTTADIFPVAAVDQAGTVYVAWSEQDAGASGSPSGAITLKLKHSSDGGKTWSPAASVNAPGVNSAVLPWIAAAGPGQVDLVYVGSATKNNPDDALATWYAYMAHSTNANGPKPSFSTVAAVPDPVRYGQVCVSGIACAGQGDDGRSLLDFISVDLDSRGCAVLAVPSSANQAEYPSKANMVTQTLVARQTSGCFSDPPPVRAGAVTAAKPGRAKKGSKRARPKRHTRR